jgi:hypothetical protein
MADSHSPAHVLAYRSLERAGADLDAVIRTLPDHCGDDTMASPALIGALFRAVTARRLFNELDAAFELEATLKGGLMPSEPRSPAQARDQWP